MADRRRPAMPASRRRGGIPNRRGKPGHSQRFAHTDLLRNRVRRKLRGWQLRGAGRTVMRWLKEGVSLDWRSQPPPPFDFGDSLAELTPNQDAFLRREVPRCLKTGAWVMI